MPEQDSRTNCVIHVIVFIDTWLELKRLAHGVVL